MLIFGFAAGILLSLVFPTLGKVALAAFIVAVAINWARTPSPASRP